MEPPDRGRSHFRRLCGDLYAATCPIWIASDVDQCGAATKADELDNVAAPAATPGEYVTSAYAYPELIPERSVERTSQRQASCAP
jgi:hypothetical protein